MSILGSIFGPSKNEIWGQIANDIGGNYQESGFFKSGVLSYTHGEWQILLDTFSRNNGKSSTSYTRMRAPFINKDNTYFKMYREHFFSSVGKFFGMQDILIGDPYFDENFVIKGNNPLTLKTLLADPELKALMNAQQRILLEIKDDDGWFGPSYPEGVDQLYFECIGVMKDIHQLKNLFELFTTILNRLVAIDSAYPDDPGITLK